MICAMRAVGGVDSLESGVSADEIPSFPCSQAGYVWGFGLLHRAHL